MQTEEFVQRVRDRLVSDEETAEAATRATLTALGQRLTPDQAGDLAAQLPAELAATVRAAMRQSDPHTGDGFDGRVAELAQTAREDAQRYVDAVLGVLPETVASEGWANLVSELPAGLADRAAAARHAGS